MDGLTLAQGAVSKYHRDGPGGLLRSAIVIGLERSINEYFLLSDNEDIFSYATTVIGVEGRSEAPINYDGIWDPPHPDQISTVHETLIARPRVVCEFENARLYGSQPVIGVDGKFIAPESIGPSTVCWRGRKSFHKNVRLSEVLSDRGEVENPDLESAFLLTGGLYDGYGHWPHEVLPKLRTYEEYTRKTGTDPVLITSGDLSTWQRELLSLMGYPSDTFQEKDARSLDVGTLLVPSHRYLTWTHLPSGPSLRDIEWVRDRIKSNVSESGTSFGDRIFVSREDAPRRHVHNRDEVRDVLEDYDFELYEPGRLTVADQVRLFSNAELIVGPTGAGLSNVIFAEDANVVELVVDTEEPIQYYILADMCGLNYEYVPCQPLQPDGLLRHSDMEVDPSQLQTVLESVLRSEIGSIPPREVA